jgi:uncharacterized membrane protein
MTKRDFLESLEKALKNKRVGDLTDILAEYEQHFALKIADGYSEEAIIAKLEEPEILAEQFAQAENGEKKSGNFFAKLGVLVLSGIAALFSLALFAWVLLMGAFSLSAFVLGSCLITTVNPANLIPPMPYFGGIIMGICSLALSVLGAVGTIYSYLYVLQLNKAYFRWAQNKTNSGSCAYPPLPMYPQLEAIFRRRLRGTALVSLALVGVFFIAGFIVLAGSAGSLGFWHIWHWFS